MYFSRLKNSFLGKASSIRTKHILKPIEQSDLTIRIYHN